MRTVVFDRKEGHIGVKRSAYKNEEKELGTNYVIDILDPVDLDTTIKTIKGFGDKEYDWHALRRSDPRVQFYHLFDIIEGGDADWYINHCENCECDEQYIENKHEVFELVRKVFSHEKEVLVKKIASLEEMLTKE